jgi:V/A-type H+-transporting ATPase subunit E
MARCIILGCPRHGFLTGFAGKRLTGVAMAEELQGLLNRIKEEGISKAEAQKEQLLGKATQEARDIVERARKEAEDLLRKARSEAKLTLEKGEASLKQAARDILIGLRKSIELELTRTVSLEVAGAMAPQALAGIIDRLVASFIEKGGKVDGIEVLLSPEDQKKLQSLVTERFVGRLKEGVSLVPVAGMDGGIKVAVKGESMYYDFSHAAMVQALSAFLNPRIARLVAEVGEV